MTSHADVIDKIVLLSVTIIKLVWSGLHIAVAIPPSTDPSCSISYLFSLIFVILIDTIYPECDIHTNVDVSEIVETKNQSLFILLLLSSLLQIIFKSI
jgi:hypothetical protein